MAYSSKYSFRLHAAGKEASPILQRRAMSRQRRASIRQRLAGMELECATLRTEVQILKQQMQRLLSSGDGQRMGEPEIHRSFYDPPAR